MQVLTRRRNLSAIELLIGAAFIVVALFAWNQQSTVVDPDQLGPENWRYQLWQIGTLVIAAAGADLVLVQRPGPAPHPNLGNGPARPRHFPQYLYRRHLWRPRWFGLGSGRRPLRHPRCRRRALGRLGRAATGAESWPSISAITGVLVFANYLFIDSETLWSALDPIMMLVALLWAVAGLSPDIGGPVGGD